MSILITGASGATGRLLVEEMLNLGHDVKIIVRSIQSMPEAIRTHANLSVTEASILDLSDAEMAELVHGCRAVVSCLGHTLSFRGIYGGPRRLVMNATRRLCDAIRANEPNGPVKFILMNTTGNSNRDLDEKISFRQKCVMALLRLILPPHVDNEMAADYLRTDVGQNDPQIEWVTVRPDTLTNEPVATGYDVYPSPIRSAIFDAGQTSRINVASFMAQLINAEGTWDTWQGKMPVIYNASAT